MTNILIIETSYWSSEFPGALTPTTFLGINISFIQSFSPTEVGLCENHTRPPESDEMKGFGKGTEITLRNGVVLSLDIRFEKFVALLRNMDKTRLCTLADGINPAHYSFIRKPDTQFEEFLPPLAETSEGENEMSNQYIIVYKPEVVWPAGLQGRIEDNLVPRSKVVIKIDDISAIQETRVQVLMNGRIAKSNSIPGTRIHLKSGEEFDVAADFAKLTRLLSGERPKSALTQLAESKRET